MVLEVELHLQWGGVSDYRLRCHGDEVWLSRTFGRKNIVSRAVAVRVAAAAVQVLDATVSEAASNCVSTYHFRVTVPEPVTLLSLQATVL